MSDPLEAIKVSLAAVAAGLALPGDYLADTPRSARALGRRAR